MVKVRVDIFRVVEELPENFDRKMTVFGKHLFTTRAELKSKLRYHAVSGRTSERLNRGLGAEDVPKFVEKPND